MMAQHDAEFHALRQRTSQIVVIVVIHQRAGVNPHAPLVFRHHLAEIAHERGPRLLSLIRAHAILRDLGNFRCRARSQKVGENRDVRV